MTILATTCLHLWRQKSGKTYTDDLLTLLASSRRGAPSQLNPFHRHPPECVYVHSSHLLAVAMFICCNLVRLFALTSVLPRPRNRFIGLSSTFKVTHNFMDSRRSGSSTTCLRLSRPSKISMIFSYHQIMSADRRRIRTMLTIDGFSDATRVRIKPPFYGKGKLDS